MRSTLVSALSACVGEHERKKARRFLQGLSSDELQYIAEFLGSCILEPSRRYRCRGELAEGIARFELGRRRTVPGMRSLQDEDHKMILLLEYLCRCGLNETPAALGAGQLGI